MKYQAVKAYTDAPSNPISVTKGEKLRFVEESDPNGDWPNWVLCHGKSKEGWVPKQILNITNSEVTSLQDYVAKEHTLVVGEILLAEYQLNGWIWCEKASLSGEFAWAPLNHLTKL